MDELDFKILSLLHKNARMSFKKIAETLGISRETVSRRYKNLQKDGVILGATVVLNANACGLTMLAGFYIKTKTGSSLSTVEDILSSIPRISMISQQWGTYDFYINAFLRDLSDLNDIITGFRKIEEINTIKLVLYPSQDWQIPFVHPLPNLPSS